MHYRPRGKGVVKMDSEHWLVTYSREVNKSIRVHLLENPAEDAILSDIGRFPHAFVLACCMDRQIDAEKAWRIPLIIKSLCREFSIEELSSLDEEWYIRVFVEQSLHHFPKKMASIFYNAVLRIKEQYDGDASRIWANRPSSATVVYRFLQFDGVGRKIATMAANILYRQYGVEFSDCHSIDVSPDVHVIRLFERAEIVKKGASKDEIIYRARDLCPEYPGVVDAACWRIGRNFCRPTNPDCVRCPVEEHCPKLIGASD